MSIRQGDSARLHKADKRTVSIIHVYVRMYEFMSFLSLSPSLCFFFTCLSDSPLRQTEEWRETKADRKGLNRV